MGEIAWNILQDVLTGAQGFMIMHKKIQQLL